MNKSQSIPPSLGLLALLAVAFASTATAGENARTLSDWRGPIGLRSSEGLTISDPPNAWVELATVPGASVAGISLRAPSGGWALASCAEIAVPVRNLGATPVRVTLQVDDAQPASRLQASPLRRRVRAERAIPADGEPCWLVVPLTGPAANPSLAGQFVSLVGLPHEFVRGGVIEAAQVKGVRLVIHDSASAQRIAVGLLVARGTPAPLQTMPVERIFPLVDEYGQYVHRDWPAKIHHDSDLAAQLHDENRDLTAHPRPADWNLYGGWAEGPQRNATGFFRVEKIDGAWWMIDPEGRLFWSHGVVRVGTRIRVGGVYRGTPLPEREHYFRLPLPDSPLAAFFGTEPPATRGYYVGRPDHAVYDHLEANLFRKYGPAWSDAYARHAQRRLASWGLNTIANSSDPDVYRRRQTPYTAIVYSAPLGGTQFRLEGSSGNWGKLPDPFDPGWSQLLRETLAAELADAAVDPWCLGFFVDNELAWGDSCHLAEATLSSPARQPAKHAFLAQIQEKYRTIDALNEAWGTTHATWAAWLEATARPDRDRVAARVDLESFSARYLEAYFDGCRAAVKAHAPHHLYLGCRFAQGANPTVMRVAARHCDVISINRYATLVSDLALPEGLDRPILIGEFHFGALDRGPLAAALVPVPDQAARAVAYRMYVESALRNPRIIGTHWFQYFDQPTTGRFDGENYQTGLADICDTPYPETIAAIRGVAAILYPTRAQLRP